MNQNNKIELPKTISGVLSDFLPKIFPFRPSLKHGYNRVCINRCCLGIIGSAADINRYIKFKGDKEVILTYFDDGEKIGYRLEPYPHKRFAIYKTKVWKKLDDRTCLWGIIFHSYYLPNIPGNKDDSILAFKDFLRLEEK